MKKKAYERENQTHDAPTMERGRAKIRAGARWFGSSWLNISVRQVRHCAWNSDLARTGNNQLQIYVHGKRYLSAQQSAISCHPNSSHFPSSPSTSGLAERSRILVVLPPAAEPHVRTRKSCKGILSPLSTRRLSSTRSTSSSRSLDRAPTAPSLPLSTSARARNVLSRRSRTSTRR